MHYIERERQNFAKCTTPRWQRIALPEDIFPSEVRVFKDVNILNSGEAVTHHLRDLIEEKSNIHPLINPSKIADCLDIDKRHLEHLGEKFNSYVNGFFNHGYLLHIAANKSAHIAINYYLSSRSPHLIDHHLVVVEAGATLDLTIDYSSSDQTRQQHYGVLKIYAAEGASVKMTKLQRLNDDSLSFDQVFSHVAGGANVIVNDVQIGCDLKVVANVQNISGYRGDAKTYSLYYGQPQSKTDIAYTIKHNAKKATSTILSKGALQEDSKKVFRGNLVFERGATGAVGKEEEFVMLLSEKIKADSIPGLFCKEDDVIGEHAASVGQVDTNKLFYVMSRGFSEKEAKKLIIKSAYEDVLQKMAITDYKSLIDDEIERRIG